MRRFLNVYVLCHTLGRLGRLLETDEGTPRSYADLVR
jgi:hypothetical protein